MHNPNLKAIVALAIIFFMGSCASTGAVVPLGPDTYMVSARNEGGQTKAKEMAVKEANSFAAEKRLHMIPIRVDTRMESDWNTWSGQIAVCDFTFRLVDETDPEYERYNPTADPDVLIQDARASQKTEVAADPLDRLLKLKALLDSGALTQEEFDREKAKLLDG